MNRMPPVSEQIEAFSEAIPGWTSQEQLLALFALAYTTDAEGDVLELGSWCGRSSAVLALAASLRGDRKVHCVDLFPEKDDWRCHADGSYSLEVVVDQQIHRAFLEHRLWAEPFARDVAPLYEKHRGILDLFNANMARYGLDPMVRTYKGTVEDFAKRQAGNFKCSLAFIDGDHDYQAVYRDIDHVERYLAIGGWICFDDAFTAYEGVSQAIRQRILENPRYENRLQLTRKLFVARKAR